MRSTTYDLRTGQDIEIDLTDVNEKDAKLGNCALSPSRIISNDERTILIERDVNIERVFSTRDKYSPLP